MRDKFRRLLGLKPSSDSPASAAPPLPVPPPSTSSPPVQPAMPAPQPLPESKPVHSVAERKTGRSSTEPLAARSDLGAPNARQQAEQYLQRLQAKIHRLADDFAEGAINRDQFQKLYEHYQRERRSIENL